MTKYTDLRHIKKELPMFCLFCNGQVKLARTRKGLNYICSNCDRIIRAKEFKKGEDGKYYG